MLEIVYLLLVGIVFDILLVTPIFWKFRFIVAFFTSVLHVVAASFLLFEPFSLAVALTLLVLSFRLINNARIFYNKFHPHRIRTLAQRSYISLALLQLLAIAAFVLFNYIDPLLFTEAITIIQFVIAIAILSFTINSIHQTKYHGNNEHLTDKELPSLTVAIPARNETADLQACIESVLSSNYPKLEVLVLDDCSQDKTPEVIKHYAHAGVRFLQGTPPKDDWLAKNHAYDQLAKEASGKYILFCGVDVRMSPSYLRNIVTHMIVKKKRMLSVMPTRLGGDIRSSFVQPMRYWREFALPRKLLKRPAVLSTCWVIQSKVLKSLGGFAAVKRSILPERYFARECVEHDTYTFIRADETLDLRTTKQPSRQLATAYRVRYPQFHNRLESIFIYVLSLQVLFVLPYALFISSFFIEMVAVQILSGLTILVLTLTHTTILNISDPANSIAGIFNFPFVVLTESYISLYSMIRYEFGTVLWKGRNVCIPILNQK